MVCMILFIISPLDIIRLSKKQKESKMDSVKYHLRMPSAGYIKSQARVICKFPLEMDFFGVSAASTTEASLKIKAQYS
jgi:hypothetical protein